MKFHTKRYDIEKVGDEGWDRDIAYEISLKDGYVFSDGSSLDFAESFDELKMLIADISEERSDL